MKSLGFDDDFSFNDQVRSVTADDNAAEDYLEWHLTLGLKSGVLKHDGQGVRVDGFYEPGTELRVNVVHPAD